MYTDSVNYEYYSVQIYTQWNFVQTRWNVCKTFTQTHYVCSAERINNFQNSPEHKSSPVTLIAILISETPLVCVQHHSRVRRTRISHIKPYSYALFSRPCTITRNVRRWKVCLVRAGTFLESQLLVRHVISSTFSRISPHACPRLSTLSRRDLTDSRGI